MLSQKTVDLVHQAVNDPSFMARYWPKIEVKEEKGMLELECE